MDIKMIMLHIDFRSSKHAEPSYTFTKKLTSLVAAGSAPTPKTKCCSLKGMQSMGLLLDVLYQGRS